MAIACVYCGGSHETAAGVRACWSEHEGHPTEPARAPLRPEPRSPSPENSRPSLSEPTRGLLIAATQPGMDLSRGLAPAKAGPDVLGRHAVVAAGTSAPPPWAGASRLIVDDAVLASPFDALVSLRSAAHSRQRLVIELGVDFDDAPVSATTVEPFVLGPRFAFELDELHHLVWGNSIDWRDPTRPCWRALDSAVHAGATAVTADGDGDLVLPSGEVVWLDGGPVRFTAPIDGVAVMHAVAVEHRTFGVPTSNDSAADLAPDQLAAVTHEGGAARIIAPAGSGKTRVLTERARHLLTRWNLPPGAVSLVAFNKRAQEEMKERTADLPQLQVRTLNAISLAIVNGSPPFAPQQINWRTIDEPDVRRIIGDLVTFPRRRNSDPVAPWIEALSLIRLGLVDPVDAESRYDGDVDGLSVAWPKVRATLERQRVVDFDDQIYRALLVLLTQPEARRVAQRASRVLLVDEFQDLTPAHVLLIRLLAAPDGAVFGVGDDDQTIYGYNGADPAWLIDFEGLFPGAGAHPLEVNYRCPEDIVEVVDRLLRHNTRRVDKTIRAAPSTGSGSDESVGWSLAVGDDPVGRTRQVVESAIGAGAEPSDVAVLTRVNAVLAPVQVALISAGVPIAGGVGLEFLQRTAVRSTLAWIRLATAGRGGPSGFNTDDVREALLRPSRSFHPRINDWIAEQSSLSELRRLAARLNNDKDVDRLLEFAADIETLQASVRDGATTRQVVDVLIESIGLAGAVMTLDAHRRGMNRAAQGDDLTAMVQLAELHPDAAGFGRWLANQLAVKRSSHGVVLATVHRVKGQEWPHVVVHLAGDDQYPHRLADDVEEERRLFHVAITRASRHATVVTGPDPSPFISELVTEPSPDRVVVRHQPEVVRSASAPKRASADPSESLDGEQQECYDALCALRQELRDGKPAYVVFDNKTAAALARAVPKSMDALLKVPGIGPAKVDKYGEAILRLLAGR